MQREPIDPKNLRVNTHYGAKDYRRITFGQVVAAAGTEAYTT